EKIELKLNQIKKYVGSLKSKPQFIGLSEIENEAVVSKIATTLGYSKFVVSKSPDKRGIDVALLFNEQEDIKMISKKEHTLKDKYFLKKPTRNILEVSFLINKKETLTFFVNHWPSLSNPTSTRIAAAKTLKKRMQALNKKGHYLIALGDFNTIPENYPRPFEDVLLKNTGFSDVHELFMSDRNIAKALKKEMPLGTYFYAPKMSWNRLDRIIINKRLHDGKKLDLVKKSYSIHNPSFSTTDYRYEKGANKGSIIKGIPSAYDHKTSSRRKAGYSDHFGLVVEFSYL
ncbi:MAG: exonuclease III, partial [Bacteriovoracaceae bacterium]